MKKRILGILTVGALAVSLGWTLAAQQPAAATAAQPQWKDAAEYDLYEAARTATDPKARLTLLDKWTQGYPQSAYISYREDFYLISYRQLNDCRKSTDLANKIRLTRPNDFQSIAAILGCVSTFMPPSAADLTNADTVAHYTLDNEPAIFSATNLASVAAAQQPAIKAQVIALAQQTIAWVPVQQKNDAKSIAEITKYLGIDGTQASFSYYLSTAILNEIKAKTEPADKLPISLFHAARAAAYTGPNAMADVSRKQIESFVTQSYTKYHGSAEGLPQLFALAKTNVFPPPGFTIVDVNTINAQAAAAVAAARAAHPDLTAWSDYILNPLKGANDAMYFDQTLKDVQFPGGNLPGVTAFKGKLVSATPTDKPKQLVLAVFDPMIPDTTLTFTEALPGHMDPGGEIEFNGVIKSYTKEPFMITFEIDKHEDISGWTGVAPAKPAAGKGGAGKSTGKGKAK